MSAATGERPLAAMRGERLIDSQRAARKGQRATREISHPDPVGLLADQRHRLVAPGGKPLAPKPRRQRVMLPPAFTSCTSKPCCSMA